jgi:hypothetical protein
MIESISAVTLATHNMPHAVRFYRVLGCRLHLLGYTLLLRTRSRLRRGHPGAGAPALTIGRPRSPGSGGPS